MKVYRIKNSIDFVHMYYQQYNHEIDSVFCNQKWFYTTAEDCKIDVLPEHHLLEHVLMPTLSNSERIEELINMQINERMHIVDFDNRLYVGFITALSNSIFKIFDIFNKTQIIEANFIACNHAVDIDDKIIKLFFSKGELTYNRWVENLIIILNLDPSKASAKCFESNLGYANLSNIELGNEHRAKTATIYLNNVKELISCKTIEKTIKHELRHIFDFIKSKHSIHRDLNFRVKKLNGIPKGNFVYNKRKIERNIDSIINSIYYINQYEMQAKLEEFTNYIQNSFKSLSVAAFVYIIKNKMYGYVLEHSGDYMMYDSLKIFYNTLIERSNYENYKNIIKEMNCAQAYNHKFNNIKDFAKFALLKIEKQIKKFENIFYTIISEYESQIIEIENKVIEKYKAFSNNEYFLGMIYGTIRMLKTIDFTYENCIKEVEERLASMRI